MLTTIKNWISDEGKRNRVHAELYVNLITRAYGPKFEMFVGHHLAFKSAHDHLTTENEIPSADTLLFDHEVMKEVFGRNALQVMIALVQVPCNEREAMLARMLAGQPMLLELCPFKVASELAGMEMREGSADMQAPDMHAGAESWGYEQLTVKP